MDLTHITKRLHPYERAVLLKLKESTTYSLLTRETGLQGVEVMRGLQWLENRGALKLEHKKTERIVIDKNGEDALKEGMPEDRLLKALKEGPATITEAAKRGQLDPQEASAVMGLLKRSGRITFNADKTLSITHLGLQALGKDSFEIKLLHKLAENPLEKSELTPELKFAYDNLTKRRQMIKTVEEKDRLVHLEALGRELIKADLSGVYADKLTAEDLKTGAWQKKEYRGYDVSINVPTKAHGKPHFVNEAIDYIKQVWLELGFQEMEGGMVQTAFWDLDALFVPQDHPAREMQDTFYLEKPAKQSIDDKKVYDTVKAAHENGGDTGSKGWGYTFDKKESEQLMLRTHTTVLSAQTLDAIRRGAAAIPGKYFSVDKVFRNESLDWKHLFEFYQVEGIVVDPDATFSHLLGYLELFFKKLGYEKVRVRPAHFPYTEPSVEVDGWHPEKKQWVELGGAGLFRPEVTKTLIGKEVPVLAWGLGMARSISEYFNITDIRDLYNNDIKKLQTMKKWVK